MAGFVDFDDVDPAVSALLTRQAQKAKAKRLPPKERRRLAQEKQRAKERLAGRVNWDLPPALKKRLNALAKAEGVPVSQLAALLLLHGLNALENGRISLEKIPSDSPRFRYVLQLPKISDK